MKHQKRLFRAAFFLSCLLDMGYTLFPYRCILTRKAKTMKFHYHGKANECGIYKISNTANGKVYYGSTKCFRKRASQHFSDLKNKRHTNILLQRAFDKYGEDAFIFEVVETVEKDKEKLLEREQHFLNQFFDDGKNCYNVCITAGSRIGSRNKKPYNPTTDGRAKSRTDALKAIVSQKNKVTWNTPEKKKEASDNAYKRWNKHSAGIEVKNLTTGEVCKIEGSVREWCKERNLSYKAFHLMVQGKTKSSGGWVKL